MWTRRQFLSRSGLAALGMAGTCFALPGDNRDGGDSRETVPDGSASKGMITPQTDQAIDRGLAYLNAHANREGYFGTGGYTGNVAVTSLAGMAFMAAGNLPNRGPYGPIVTNALRFVLNQDRDQTHPGFLHNPQASPHGPMYGHGFATLFLAEASGMVHDKTPQDERQQETARGGQAHPRQPELRRWLALHARQHGSRPVGDDLPDHGPAPPATPASPCPKLEGR